MLIGKSGKPIGGAGGDNKANTAAAAAAAKITAPVKEPAKPAAKKATVSTFFTLSFNCSNRTTDTLTLSWKCELV